MNKHVITAAVFAAIAVTSAAAAEVNPWYLSGVVGRSDFKINNADFSPLTVTSIDKKDTQFGIAAGYRFSPFVAVELGYLDFGKAKISASYLGIGVNAEGKANTIHASVLLAAPIADVWSIYGRLGAARTDRKITASASGLSISDSEKKSEALFGIGFGYAFSNNFTGTLEYQKLNDTDVSAVNLGFRVSF